MSLQLDLAILLDETSSNPLKELVNEINSISNEVSLELLGLLNQIAARGPGFLQC